MGGRGGDLPLPAWPMPSSEAHPCPASWRDLCLRSTTTPHRLPFSGLWTEASAGSAACLFSVLCPALVTLSLTFRFVSDFHPQIRSQSPKPVWLPWGCPVLCSGPRGVVQEEVQALPSWAPGGSGLLG